MTISIRGRCYAQVPTVVETKQCVNGTREISYVNDRRCGRNPFVVTSGENESRFRMSFVLTKNIGGDEVRGVSSRLGTSA